MASLAVVPVPPAPAPDPEPKLDDFNASDTPYEDFTKAFARWTVRQERKSAAPVDLVPAPAAKLTLYALEEQLVAFADTAEMVSPEEEEQFLQEFQTALTAAVEKRDRVGQFMVHMEAQAALAAAEIKRLQERKQFYERALERIEQYVVRVIESLGVDVKGKPRKLEGNTMTFSIAKCPTSVEIKDEALVPAEYKSATITLPLPLWEELLDSLDLDFSGKVVDGVRKPAITVSKTAVKAALDAKTNVPGALLETGKKRLVRK